MDDTTKRYAASIEAAKRGSGQSIAFLRRRLARTAISMPPQLLVALSEVILEYRRGEMRSEAERN